MCHGDGTPFEFVFLDQNRINAVRPARVIGLEGQALTRKLVTRQAAHKTVGALFLRRPEQVVWKWSDSQCRDLGRFRLFLGLGHIASLHLVPEFNDGHKKQDHREGEESQRDGDIS